MQPKELADALWTAFASDSRWDGISGAERVNDTTITVAPFEGRPVTITIKEQQDMKTYDVHLCAVVLVKLEGIQASGQREAIKRAEERFNNERIGDALGLRVQVPGADAVFAEDVLEYLVDEEDDPERERSRWYAVEDVDRPADEVRVSSKVDPDWVAMVCEWVDLFRSDHCGYWLRGVAREPGLGCLAWEDDEQHDFGQEPDLQEALAAWKEGRPLPEGYHRLDADFARRSWGEGVKLAGERWYEEGDSDRYDQVVQQTLFGKQVYG